MMNFAPLVLLVVAIAGSLFYTKPAYDKLTLHVNEKESYAAAVVKGKEFESVQQELINKMQGIPMEDQENLKKMIPDNVDNVRLIIEINEMAKRYSSGVKNIRVGDAEKQTAKTASTPVGNTSFGFTISTSYELFGDFLRDLESNLRLADVTMLRFNPTDSGSIYDFNLTIKTQWLKQ